jgi:hypothetical protein
MLFYRLFKKLYRDNRGQNAVESFMLVIVLVVFIAAALHGILPHLGEGFMEMAKAIGGPTP